MAIAWTNSAMRQHRQIFLQPAKQPTFGPSTVQSSGQDTARVHSDRGVRGIAIDPCRQIAEGYQSDVDRNYTARQREQHLVNG